MQRKVEQHKVDFRSYSSTANGQQNEPIVQGILGAWIYSQVGCVIIDNYANVYYYFLCKYICTM